MKIPENMPPLTIYKYLLPKRYYTLGNAYIRWLMLLAYRGLKIKNMTPRTFNLLYKSVSHHWSEKRLLGYLQQQFIKENLSLSLLLEPIDGFDWLSKNRYPLQFSGSSPIMLQIIAPLSRFIAALNNQHPPFYQPFSNLLCTCLTLYVLNMPELEAVLKTAGVTVDKENLNKTLPLLFEESKQVLLVTKGLINRCKIGCYLGLCQTLIEKKQQKKMDFLDYFNSFLYGIWYTLTIRGKSIRQNRI